MHEPDFTLSAGPTMSSLRVQQAQGRPMIFDYDPVFLERFRETERMVGELFLTEKDVVLMQGEAVLGIEAAARGVVRPGLKCLNLVSGVYAKWFGDWLRSVPGRGGRAGGALRRGTRPRRGGRGARATRRHRARGARAFGDPVGNREPTSRDRSTGQARGGAGLRRRGVRGRRHQRPHRRLGRRHLCRRAAEVPCRSTRDVPGGGQR